MLTHAEGEGQAAFSRWKHSMEVTSERDDVTCKQSLFVEPVSWMQSDVQQLQGKVEQLIVFHFAREMEPINKHETCFF